MCEILEMDNIDKGEVIDLSNQQDKSIFFLKKGTVKIIDSKSDTVKYIVKKGNIFGELSLQDTNQSTHEKAIALEDSIICYIEAHRMEKLMEKHKSLKNGILKIYGLRIKKLERRLRDLLYKDSASRISDFIKDYILEFGEEEGHKIVAKNLLSHKDISNLTNTSRQTVSNVMSQLRKDSIIDYNTQYISILKEPIPT
ncbi:Crp/Fnr family transcriptional regulator [Aquimarina sp. D1M17]|uniref:Crp/Fnr family transcriptional regulator n=1 Tax=Aquimarina acroporae TaxID=2937283 RepID=UPI0020BF0452|nr:Crp/Fnr family transcriptional regulator [Aquimarina acroporae]MCK8521440.1 Crp/Fnr family transcriptional regulator [Aquimarina acroporae]